MWTLYVLGVIYLQKNKVLDALGSRYPCSALCTCPRWVHQQIRLPESQAFLSRSDSETQEGCLSWVSLYFSDTSIQVEARPWKTVHKDPSLSPPFSACLISAHLMGGSVLHVLTVNLTMTDEQSLNIQWETPHFIYGCQTSSHVVGLCV